jgi:hypothetical protein
MNSKYLTERVADLRIYSALLKGILENKLYFLEIKAGRKVLHKIGITKRSIEKRIAEVKRDLAVHYKSVEIKVLNTWNHRGNVELYFKHKYKKFNYKIGKLTEYFRFADEVELVLKDLEQMEPKNLAQVELDIIEGKMKFTVSQEIYFGK